MPDAAVLMVASIAWDLSRIVGGASVVITVVLLLVAVAACRRTSPVRVRWDLARMVLAGLGIVVMAAVTGVFTPGAAVGLAIATGVLIGAAQGWFSRVEMAEGRVFTRKTVWGVAAWGIGVLVMQTAGVVSRAGGLKAGQTISWLGLALLVGNVLARQQRIADTRSRPGVALTGVGLIAMLALTPFAALVGPVTSAAADTLELTDDEVCSLLPQDRGFTLIPGIAPPSPSCQATIGDCDSEYAQKLTCMSGFVMLLASPEEAQRVLEPESGFAAWHPIPGLGDNAYGGCPMFACAVRFQRDRFYVDATVADVLGVEEAQQLAVEIDRKIDALLATASEPEPVEPEPIEPEPVGPGPEPDVVEPGPKPDSGDGDGEDQLVVPPPSATADGEEISSAEALGTSTAGLVAAGAIGLISLIEAGGLGGAGGGERRLPPDLLVRRGGGTAASGPAGPGASGVSPGGRTTTVYVTGARAEAVIQGGAGSVVEIPGEQQWGQNVSIPGEPPVRTDRVGSHGVVRSVGPIVRGPDDEVSVAVEVDPFTLPDVEPITGPEPELAEPVPPRPPPVDEGPPPIPGVEPILTPGEPPEPLPSRPPPVDEGPPPIPGVEPILTPGEPPEPLPSRPLPDEAQPPPIEEAPPPPGPPGEGERLTPQQIEGGIDQGMGDFERVRLDGGTRPGDPAGDDGVWVDMDGDGRPDAIAWVGPDGTMVVAADTDADGVADTLYVDQKEGAPDAGPKALPIDEEPPTPPTDEEPPPIDEELSPVDEKPAGGEPFDAGPDVRLTDEEIDRIVRWGQSVGRPYPDVLADLAAENRAAGGSGRVEIPDRFQREYEDYFRATVKADGLRSEREALREQIAELNRQAQQWTALEQASASRFFAGLRDVAQQQANYEAARAELLGERARLEDLGGSAAEIREVDRQLGAIEEDHSVMMRSTGVVGEEERRLQGLRNRLRELEQGASPSDPDEMERTRREVGSLEASVEHIVERSVRGEQLGTDDLLDEFGFGDLDQPAVAEVEPAEGIDRGTWFDRPARELERIARERDALLSRYRSLDEELDEAERAIREYRAPWDE